MSISRLRYKKSFKDGMDLTNDSVVKVKLPGVNRIGVGMVISLRRAGLGNSQLDLNITIEQ